MRLTRAGALFFLATGGVAPLLTACAVQPRLHSARELTALADRCDVRETELAQHRERPEIFYYLNPTASEAQLLCVGRWAKKNGLRMVYVEAVQEEPEAQP